MGLETAILTDTTCTDSYIKHQVVLCVSPFVVCCLIEKHGKLVHRGNGGRLDPEGREEREDQRWDIWKQCLRLCGLSL